MSLLSRPRPATPGTVYASKRCVACGREPRLTQIRRIAEITSRTGPYDVTEVEVCVDRADCIANTPKED